MLILLLGACGGGPTPSTEVPEHLLVDAPYTALQGSWAPRVPDAATQAAIDDGSLPVTDPSGLLAAGLGVDPVPGQPWQDRAELAPEAPDLPPGERRSLLYLWQSADSQLIDEESPIRLEALTPLYRPHGHLTVQVFEAHVRTARRLSELSGRPFDVAVLTGDLTDGSGANELGWVLDTLEGGVLDPDSGADDDPVPGPGNDFNDPLMSVGLGVPWYAVLGNHETLWIGGFGPLTDALREAAVGTEIYAGGFGANGFRDGAVPDAPVRTEGPTPADPDRLPLRLPEVLQRLAEAPGEPPGHGFTDEALAAGTPWYSVHPLPGRPIRLIGLHTVGVASQGEMSREQLDWLRGELTEADALGELVVVTSHHRSKDFSGTSPVSGEDLVAALAASDGVVVHLVGHGHFDQASLKVDTADPTGGYWELMLASTVDFPMQTRVLELVDEGNGTLSVYATNVDHNSPVGSLAHEARSLAAATLPFGGFHGTSDVPGFWEDDRAAQDLRLRVRLTAAQQQALAGFAWPTRIESEETLAALDGAPEGL